MLYLYIYQLSAYLCSNQFLHATQDTQQERWRSKKEWVLERRAAKHKWINIIYTTQTISLFLCCLHYVQSAKLRKYFIIIVKYVFLIRILPKMNSKL